MSSLNNNDFQIFSKPLAYISACFGKCKRLFDESYYYFIPGNSVLQTSKNFHKSNEWMYTDFWTQSAPMAISIIARIHNHLYQQDIEH